MAEKAALDGLYVIRTALPREPLSAPTAARHYRSLSQVGATFCSLKSDDLKIRPIYHRTSEWVRAHLRPCMLAYYVKWHMSEAWRDLLFADEDREHRAETDPVAAATRYDAAPEKVAAMVFGDGPPAHSNTDPRLPPDFRLSANHGQQGHQSPRWQSDSFGWANPSGE